MEENRYTELKNRIWSTYKARINAAERLKKSYNFIAFLSIYYSAILSGVSICNYATKSETMDIFSIVMSVLVTILFLYFEGQNYKERYANMKKNYSDIYLLYYKVENAIYEEKTSEDDFKKLVEEYVELLNKVENHSIYDYIKYMLDDNNIMQFNQVFKYYIRKMIVFILKAIFIMIPSIFLLISMVQTYFKFR